VTSSSSEGRENKVLVRFTDHASITLVDHYGTSLTDDFTYLAPNLTNGSITVIGIEEGSSGLALAHKDNLAPGQSGIAIDIPDPPVLTAPSAGTVTPSTQFRWASSFSGFVLHIEDEDLYQGIYVVTSSKQVTLPVFEDGFALRADAPHWWEVQTHGDPASVDDMAGPHGFADAHGYYRNTNASPPRDGSFTVSLSRGFNTAP
jgi:hypothetical protein